MNVWNDGHLGCLPVLSWTVNKIHRKLTTLSGGAVGAQTLQELGLGDSARQAITSGGAH